MWNKLTKHLDSGDCDHCAAYWNIATFATGIIIGIYL